MLETLQEIRDFLALFGKGINSTFFKAIFGDPDRTENVVADGDYVKIRDINSGAIVNSLEYERRLVRFLIEMLDASKAQGFFLDNILDDWMNNSRILGYTDAAYFALTKVKLLSIKETPLGIKNLLQPFSSQPVIIFEPGTWYTSMFADMAYSDNPFYETDVTDDSLVSPDFLGGSDYDGDEYYYFKVKLQPSSETNEKLIGELVFLAHVAGVKYDIQYYSIPAWVPRIASITSTTANGTYGIGQAINIRINFDRVMYWDALIVEMSATSGGFNGFFAPANGNGTYIDFTYVVNADESSPDLNISLFSVYQGTLIDSAGRNLNSILPVGNNLADNKDIVIDAQIIHPEIVSITTTTPDGTYGVGQTINILATFSLRVYTGAGASGVRWTFNSGATAEQGFGPGDGMQIPINYTISPGENASDLTVTHMTLIMGTLKGVDGNNAKFNLPIGNNLADNSNIVIST
jgi:hypothetical protein